MSNKPIIQCFSDDLQEVVNRYLDSGITLGEAVGAIELIKLDMVTDQKRSDEFLTAEEEDF